MIVSARAFLPLTDDYYDISASAADVLRNVSGGTMVATRYLASVTPSTTAFAISNGTNNLQTRALLDSDALGAGWRVGGRTLDADNFASVLAGTPIANNMVVQAGRLNYAGALAANFVNGALVGSESAFLAPSNTSDTASLRLRVFSNLAGSGAFQSGPVTDLCLYNRAPTNAQIFALSRYFAGRTGGAVTV
jgi:hypothetical protein